MADEAEGEDSGVHRLRDIVVEEVSLVDRAANKRRFLVVKRSEDTAAGEDAEEDVEGEDAAPKPGAKGKKSKAATGKAKGARRAAADEAEKARSAKDDEDDEEETEKAQPAKDDEDDEDDEDDGTKNAPKKSTKRKPGATSAAKADDELVLPAAAKTAILGVLTTALERLTEVVTRVKEADEPDDDADASIPEDLTEELEEIGELIEDVGEQLEDATEKRAVTKAGARMSKDRLSRYQKALELLSDVLKELTATRDQVAPTAGAAESKVGKRDLRQAGDAPGMKELVLSIGELTRVVKRQEGELAHIRKTRGVSNAIPVDGGRRSREPEEVSWPLDMNRPISRDSVKKAVSFFED